MTRVATMGTSSCATIAIQDFKHKPKEYNNCVAWNEWYLNNKEQFTPPEKDVQRFYEDVLYPIRQDLGRSGQYPFDALMDALDKSVMKSKFMIVTLNKYQQFTDGDGYWPKRMAARGFELIDVSFNIIGSENYIYTRNNNRRPMP